MDTSLIGTEAVDVLSRITGQKLSQRELTPPVIFLSALVTVLLGVIFADSQVTSEEKQRLQATLNKFIPPTGNVRQLTQLMVKGVRENLDYTKPSQLVKLVAPLSKSERLLLIAFGYEMSAADGEMDTREKRYLEIISDRLNINPRHLAVLEAVFIRQGTVDTNEYLTAFKSFTQSIEKFLTFERGSQEIKQSITKINGLIQSSLEGLHQAEEVLNGKLTLSETGKQTLLEQIGEASRRDVKLWNLAKKLNKEAIQEAVESWGQWKQGLAERMTEQSKQWSSEHSHIWSRDNLIRDYTDQFGQELEREINNWGTSQLRDKLLTQKMVILDREIRQELEALQQSLKILDDQINTNFGQQLDFTISEINSNLDGATGIFGGVGFGGLGAAALFALTPITIIPAIITGVVAIIVGSVGLWLADVDGIHDKIKQKVCELGFQKFDESKTQIDDQLYKIISSVFNSRIEAADAAIKQVISCYENLLDQQEKAHKETVEQRENEKAFIAQKRQELEQLQKNIEAILPS